VSKSDFSERERFLAYLKVLRNDLLEVRERYLVRLQSRGITSSELKKISLEWVSHGLDLKYVPDSLDIRLEEFFSEQMVNKALKSSPKRRSKQEALAPVDVVRAVVLLSNLEKLSDRELVALATGHTLARIELGVSEDWLIKGANRIKQSDAASRPRESRVPEEMRSHITKVLDMRRGESLQGPKLYVAITQTRTGLGLSNLKKLSRGISYQFKNKTVTVSLEAIRNFVKKNR
jgi:hypothetical protein